MALKLKHKVALGATGLAVLAGGAGAYAATTGGTGRDAFLDDVASRLHVSRTALDNALEGASDAQLDAAVKAGTITQSQADAIRQRMEAHGTGGFGGGPLLGHGGRGGPGFGAGLGPREWLATAATYLGMGEADLRTALQKDGTSLADVAKDKGKDVAGLKAALKAAATKQLDQALAGKKITQAQHDEMAKRLGNRIDAIVDRDGLGPLRGGGARRGGPWGGGPGGHGSP
jgi:hypothetical protein